MAREILARLAAVPVAAWVLLGAAVVLVYFARPIVRRLRFIPAEKHEPVAMAVKAAALLVAAAGVLLAMDLL